MPKATIEVPIELIRDLLQGVLSGNCWHVPVHRNSDARLCIVHRSILPCVSQELAKLIAKDTVTVDSFLRADREDWLGSPDADDEQDT